MSNPFGWLPVGPSTVLQGAGQSQPRVSGRVRDIAVSPNGKRIYIAAAGGGVWYSSDTGSTWSPVGNWIQVKPSSPSNPPPDEPPPIISPASPISCGCLLVDFGQADDGTGDDVYVGTGELYPDLNQGTPGFKLGGIGVLHLDIHVQDAISQPFVNPWKREAVNLTGLGIIRLARDPRLPRDASNKASIVAACSKGLFFRTGPFKENAKWTAIPRQVDEQHQIDMRPTDVVWLPNGRIWVADVGTTNDPGVLRFSDPSVNTAPVFAVASKVDLPNVLTTTNRRQRLTIGTIGAPPDNNRFYVLGSGPHLWRINNNSAQQMPDDALPADLFTADGNDQSVYDSALAVRPAGANDIVFAGGAGRVVDGDENASLHRFRFPTGSGAIDSAYIGLGIHPDVHQVVPAADGSVWVVCDGGVFRSPTGDPLTFVARNTGLPVLETGFVANSAVSDSFILAGSQDNGILIRAGDTVWYSFPNSGDGGDVMFHPVQNSIFFAQVKGTQWEDNHDTLPPPIERKNPLYGHPGEPAIIPPTRETNDALSYSTGDIRKVGNEVRLAFGSNRVWYVKNWDATGRTKNTWVTLPGGDDPLTDAHGAARRDTKTDVYNFGHGQIVSCRWMSDTRLIVLVQRQDRPSGTDSAVLLLQDSKSWDRIELSKGPPDFEFFTSLPALGGWSEIGIHDPTRLDFGSFYVACTGFTDFVIRTGELFASPFVDTLYWFDGKRRWLPTGLRAANHPPDNVGTTAPALSVVCDTDGPNNIVYVGTSIGVWQGTQTFTGNNPSWTWQPFSKDLPAVAVQDLAICRAGNVKLLRAATQSRGIWEVDLVNASPPSLLYLRVHPLDSRRQLPSPLANPTDKGRDPWVWFASPDIRIRPAPGQAAPPPPADLKKEDWTRGSHGRFPFQLWTFQTAFRHNRNDPRCRPTGEWSLQFDECLLPGGQASKQSAHLSAALWSSIVTQADVYAAPWDGEPTEADLLELIVEDRDEQDPAQEIFAGPPRYSLVTKRSYKIDVLVHYRDLTPLPAGQVKVTLLYRPQTVSIVKVSGTSSKVPDKVTIPAAFGPAVTQLMTGGTFTPVDSWKVADKANPVRSPNLPVDVTRPVVVTFDLDLSSADFASLKRGNTLALLAIAHRVPAQGADPGPALTGATMENLVLNSIEAAARMITLKA